MPARPPALPPSSYTTVLPHEAANVTAPTTNTTLSMHSRRTGGSPVGPLFSIGALTEHGLEGVSFEEPFGPKLEIPQ